MKKKDKPGCMSITGYFLLVPGMFLKKLCHQGEAFQVLEYQVVQVERVERQVICPKSSDFFLRRVFDLSSGLSLFI